MADGGPPALAIETATAACSAALIEGGAVVAARREIVGRGHAERLVPMVDELLRGAGVARPSAILVGCGPGSFTGVRVGLAAAIGMAIGWGIEVRGIGATALVAARLFADESTLDACAVAMTGGHGELFVERFARSLASLSPLASLPPALAAATVPDEVVAGSGAAALIAARGRGRALDRLPDAADAALLPVALRLPPRPIYGRAPDARIAA